MNPLIAIVTCRKHAARVEAQRQTWIPQAVQAGFDVEIFDGERLGVPDDYYSLPAKTKAICQWADGRRYENMLKADDDGYIVVARLQLVPHDYAGIRVPPNDLGSVVPPGAPAKPRGTYPAWYASGGAYWMSRRSICTVAAEPLSHDWAEDRWVGNVLARRGIKLEELFPEFTWVPANQSVFNFCSDKVVAITQIAKPDDILACHSHPKIAGNWPPLPKPCECEKSW